MNPTDEIRAELTRLGVKWKPKRGRKHDGTEWHDQFGAHVEALQGYTWDGSECPEGKLLIARGPNYLTPAQAIAATLGTGTCHEVKIDRHYRGCSECGNRWEYMYAVGWQIGPNFCPNCGRKVVGE